MPLWYTDNGIFEPLPASGCGPLTFSPVHEFNTRQDNMTVVTGCTIQALRTTSSNTEITGLTGGTAGVMVRLANVGAAKMKLKDQNTNSAAANRMMLDGDLELKAGQILELIYNATLQRWMRVQ